MMLVFKFYPQKKKKSFIKFRKLFFIHEFREDFFNSLETKI